MSIFQFNYTTKQKEFCLQKQIELPTTYYIVLLFFFITTDQCIFLPIHMHPCHLSLVHYRSCSLVTCINNETFMYSKGIAWIPLKRWTCSANNKHATQAVVSFRAVFWRVFHLCRSIVLHNLWQDQKMFTNYCHIPICPFTRTFTFTWRRPPQPVACFHNMYFKIL